MHVGNRGTLLRLFCFFRYAYTRAGVRGRRVCWSCSSSLLLSTDEHRVGRWIRSPQWRRLIRELPDTVLSDGAPLAGYLSGVIPSSRAADRDPSGHVGCAGTETGWELKGSEQGRHQAVFGGRAYKGWGNLVDTEDGALLLPRLLLLFIALLEPLSSQR